MNDIKQPDPLTILPSVIFLVEGTTGEYDDYQEWVVGACFDVNQAQERVEKLNQWY